MRLSSLYVSQKTAVELVETNQEKITKNKENGTISM